MVANLIIAPEVKGDVGEAYNWYEVRRVGLGEEFLGCIDASIESICRIPEAHSIVHEQYRRAIVRRFPYSIFFEYANGTVTIYCVFHNSRNPEKWRERLP